MIEPPPRTALAARHRRWWLPLALLIILLLVAAGSYLRSRQTGFPSPDPTSSAVPAGQAVASPATAVAEVTGIFIEPGDGRAPVLDEIAAARRSLDLEIYIVSDSQILRALEDAAHRGVAARVILEQHPFGGEGGQPEIFARLQDAGIAVRWGNPVFRFTHIKTMVVDDAVAVIMNQNLTASSFTQNREFGVVTNRPDAVRTAASVFAADWARGAEPDPAPLVVSPTNARAELLALIEGARSSLDVYAEVLQDDALLNALADAARRGVRVRLIVTPAPDNADARAALAHAGIEVHLLSNLYVHAKLIVADGERAFVGSQNLSATSLDQNRELGIIVADPVSLSRLSRTFDLDFAAGKPQPTPRATP